MEDGKGVSVVLLSNARVVLATTDDKQPRCKLLGEIANDDNSKEDTEGNTDVPCSKAQLELIATGEDSLLGGRLERTTDFDTTGNDETSLDDTNGNSGVLSSFAIPELSATNDELLMANLFERQKTVKVLRLYFGLPHSNSLQHRGHYSPSCLNGLRITLQQMSSTPRCMQLLSKTITIISDTVSIKKTVKIIYLKAVCHAICYLLNTNT